MRTRRRAKHKHEKKPLPAASFPERTSREIFSPTTFVIFGATGDLSKRKLIPALLDLYLKGLLPKIFRVVGFSRSSFSHDAFREFMRGAIIRKAHGHKKKDIEKFLQNVFFVKGDFKKARSYQDLAESLIALDQDSGRCSNKLFYLAVPPGLYEVIFQNLAHSGLSIPCAADEGWTRVLVEKPFGEDVKTAQKLDNLLGLLFKEEQIFRIDHYLAKDTVQNILAFRFSNSLLEPAWNKNYVEKIEVMLLEQRGVDARGSFYDGIGALRDVGQNHALQLLALFVMDNPEHFDAPSIRKKRAEIFKKLLPLTSSQIKHDTLRAQYRGYRSEKGVKRSSATETYFSIKAHLATPKWKGVPIYLTSGKALEESRTEVAITFKHPSPCLCPPSGHVRYQDTLSYRIQPQEGISLCFWVKKPGPGMELEKRSLEFDYRSAFPGSGFFEAYEKLLLDGIQGNQTLFVSTEEIRASWKFIDPILNAWSKNVVPLLKYRPGSRGPRGGQTPLKS